MLKGCEHNKMSNEIKKLYINRGHSNTDPGAVGYIRERTGNVKVGDYMEEYLLANYVVQIRSNPGTLSSLTAIAKDANNWGADLFVSIHFNAGKGDGYESLVYGKSRYDLGKCFEKYILAVGQNSRGVKYRPDLGVLRLTNMPAILGEMAFVDNIKDIQDWDEDFEFKKLGIAYAKAAAEWLGLPKKVTTPATKPAATTSTSKYTVGKDYTLQTRLKVRTGAGTNYAQKKVKNLTAGGKKAAVWKGSNDGAVFEKGTVVTALQVATLSNGNIWIRVPSGWVCAKEGNEIYIK